MALITTKVSLKVKNIPQPDSAEIMHGVMDVDFPTTALAVNDVIELAELNPNIVLQDYGFHFPQVDSNGTPTFAFSFGVLNAAKTALTTTFASGITAGRTTTVVRNTTVDAAQSDASTTRKLGILVTAAAATYAGASKTGQVTLSLRG